MPTIAPTSSKRESDSSAQLLSTPGAAWGEPEGWRLERGFAQSDALRMVEQLHQPLQALAAAQRRKLRPDATLNTTALVHELYLKFANAGTVQVQSEKHFFALAALAMRQILIDRARARASGAAHDLEALELPTLQAHDASELLALNQALEAIEQTQPRLVRVVECLYFAGYTETETGVVLGINERTVRRDFAKARALLHVALQGG